MRKTYKRRRLASIDTRCDCVQGNILSRDGDVYLTSSSSLCSIEVEDHYNTNGQVLLPNPHTILPWFGLRVCHWHLGFQVRFNDFENAGQYAPRGGLWSFPDDTRRLPADEVLKAVRPSVEERSRAPSVDIMHGEV